MVITQVKTSTGKDKYNAVQVGVGFKKNLSKSITGHVKKAGSFGIISEFKVTDTQDYAVGKKLDLSGFQVGEVVKAVGTSKGRGFQGVVKRHHFAGGPASHGHKDNLRMPGSIGAGGVQRVFKGMRMGGHMGDARVTVKNLEVVAIDAKTNEIMIKGAVPGARGGLLLISTNTGKMEVEITEAPKAEEKFESPVVEAAPANNTATA
jgi:large subunit ribosomal protein L3